MKTTAPVLTPFLKKSVLRGLSLPFLLGLMACAGVSKVTSPQGEGIGRADLKPLNPESRVEGVVLFTPQRRGKIKVEAHVSGLKSEALHGFHIHEFGDCSDPEGLRAGGHFDPQGGQPHGGPHSAHRHLGDLGNLQSDKEGQARYKKVFHGLKFFGARGILGRSVVVHIDPDDLKTQPAGDSGPRVACGVIGWTQLDEEKE